MKGEGCSLSARLISPAEEGYIVVIGEYAKTEQKALEEARRKALGAGVVPVVEPGAKRKETMTRVHVGEIASKEAARNTIARLRSFGAKDFILAGKYGKLQLYGGSYADPKGAAREQRRLKAMGITATLKEVEVSVPTQLLTVGCYPTGRTALEKVKELGRFGVKATIKKRARGAEAAE